MGYSAKAISHPEIRIPREKAKQFLDELQFHEPKVGHISWCTLVDSYIVAHGDLSYASASMMEDYGFITRVNHETHDVILSDWGGDKIGSSWDIVWEALAVTVDPTIHTLWHMVGEYDEQWIQSLHQGISHCYGIVPA